MRKPLLIIIAAIIVIGAVIALFQFNLIKNSDGIEEVGLSSIGNNEPIGEVKKYAVQTISPDADKLQIIINLPSDMKFNDNAPFAIDIESNNNGALTIGSFKYPKAQRLLAIPIRALSGEATITAAIFFSYCEAANESICFFKDVKLEMPVEVSDHGDNSIKVEYDVIN